MLRTCSQFSIFFREMGDGAVYMPREVEIVLRIPYMLPKSCDAGVSTFAWPAPPEMQPVVASSAG